MVVAGISIEELDRRIRATGFSGVVSYARSGEATSSSLEFGYADRGHRVPNTALTRFAMASGSKAFTAVAVGMLIQEGRIALGARLEECIGSRHFHFGSKITVGQLLNHTSGIPDYFSEESETDFAALWRTRPCYTMTSTRDYLPLFESAAMKATPGRDFLYCNAGFVLLGLVVEEATGRDFRDVIAQRILLPCGMARTGYFAMDALPDDTALGYLDQDERDRRTNIFAVPSIGGPDGGAFSTAGDLRLFWTSLLAGRLLGQDLLPLFLSPSVQVTEREGDWHYGYGFWLKRERTGWVVSIEGRDPGASMISRVRLSDGRITTVLSNHQDGAWDIDRLLQEAIAAG